MRFENNGIFQELLHRNLPDTDKMKPEEGVKQVN